MLFEEIEEYDEHADNLKSVIEIIGENLDEFSTKKEAYLCYVSLNLMYFLILINRARFMQIKEKIDLYISDNMARKSFSLSLYCQLFEKLNAFLNVLSKSKPGTGFNISDVEVSHGLIHLSFRLACDEIDSDDAEFRYSVFQHLFEILECGQCDLKNLKQSLDSDCLESYRDFLNFLIKNNLDLTLENSSRSVSLTREDAEKVCEIFG